ncbi:hypothetical protein PCYB_031260 [Plasmodium cynomolgi strain B]|uniref:Sporozoite-specific protein S10 n=1 Tax=Plasmodium cynomolgi (strain B) TaxID=1120755 RepID=K6UI61_PLACD|nr:hypothetical protein PCYB_031260 [Plasmodium cynomolgi strain B]GAB64713.1 hypothetical protein PCYB_031260 [Plasmodium cynomolgi strain B]
MRIYQVVLLLVLSFTVSHLYNYGKLKCGKWTVRKYSERVRWRMLNGEVDEDFLQSGNLPDGRNDEHSVNEEISRAVPSEEVEFIDKDTGESMHVDVEELGRNHSHRVTESGPSMRSRNGRDVHADQETGEIPQGNDGGVEKTDSSLIEKNTVEGGSDGRYLLMQHGEEEKEKQPKRSIQGSSAEEGLKSIPNDTMTAIKGKELNWLRNIISKINYVQAIGELLKVADEGERQSSGRSILWKAEKEGENGRDKEREKEREEERENAALGDILGGNNPNGGKKGELPNGAKNDEMIKGYANVLLNERKNMLKENVRNFLSRVFNLIVREKLMTRICNRGGEVPGGAQQDGADKPKGEECAKRRTGDCSRGKASSHPSGDSGGDSSGGPSGNPTVDPKGDHTNCHLPKLSGTKFYQSEDLYNYYSSLEEMLKSRNIRWKTDRVSRYFTFYPSKKIKDSMEDVMENKIFIESVRSVLFDSHEKNKQNVYTSFAVVVETLFSLIKEEKVIADMYSYVNLFFQDIDILNIKVLNFLKNSSTENHNFGGTPDLSLTNFEYILAKIYSRSVLANIFSTKMNHSDSKKLSRFLISRNNDLKFTFLEKVQNVNSVTPSDEGVSAMVLTKEGGEVNVPIPVTDDTLCKFIPIRKKLLYEKLSVTRKIAEEVILDYLFRLLLRKVHEYVME